MMAGFWPDLTQAGLFFSPTILLLWFPGLALGVLLLLLTRRLRHFLVSPLVVLGTVALFYGALRIFEVTPGGETVWEHVFPDADFYGHLTPDAKRPALILDGDFSRDLLQWLYYDEATPRLEPICRHATDWRCIPGQYSHPHPLTDASGRWISFTSARNGRSDVYVVDTK